MESAPEWFIPWQGYDMLEPDRTLLSDDEPDMDAE
jgi:hypothetical protein